MNAVVVKSLKSQSQNWNLVKDTDNMANLKRVWPRVLVTHLIGEINTSWEKSKHDLMSCEKNNVSL